MAKRLYFIREGKLIAHSHFGENQISGAVKTYIHSRATPVTEYAMQQEVGVDETPEALLEVCVCVCICVYKL